MVTLRETAHVYYQAGLVPLPRIVGHIEPSYLDMFGQIHAITWGRHKTCRPDWDTIARWFSREDASTLGITLLTGTPAGKGCPLPQILDCETAEVFESFIEGAQFAGLSDILYRCVIERTPSGGGHIGFLCTAIDDSQKVPLARRAVDRKLLVELLQHQPCTVAPTSFQSKPDHPVGVAYTLVQGDWTQLHEISPAQRQALLAIARTFNEVPDTVRPGPRRRTGNGQLPGDALNQRADTAWWHDLLTKHGWRDVSRPGLRARGITYWQRPGKTGREPSATLGACGQYLYVFSSNAFPLQTDTAYSPFSAYVLLEYDGNFTAAARALAKQGYGDARRREFVDPWLGPRSQWCGVPIEYEIVEGGR
jgi:hypothetical protein